MAHPLILSSGVWSGYDARIDSVPRRSAAETFQVWSAPCTRPVESLYLESRRAAREFRDATDKEIVVLYSGGMDSEWILESFWAEGITVTPLIVVYEHELNAHDVQWAQRYLQRRGVTNERYYRLDLEAWCRSEECRAVAEAAQTPELAYTAQFKAMLATRNPDTVFVTGYDEPLIVASDAVQPREWRLTYAERHYSVIKMFEAFELAGVPHFSRWSQHLWTAYTRNPINQLLAANLYNPTVWNSEQIKTQLFRASFPFMEARTKYTGFERSNKFIVELSKSWALEQREKWGFSCTSEWSRDIREVWREQGAWS